MARNFKVNNIGTFDLGSEMRSSLLDTALNLVGRFCYNLDLGSEFESRVRETVERWGSLEAYQPKTVVAAAILEHQRTRRRRYGKNKKEKTLKDICKKTRTTESSVRRLCNLMMLEENDLKPKFCNPRALPSRK